MLNQEAKNNKAQAFIDFIKIKDKNETREYSLSEEQVQILAERKEKHLNNESKSLKWIEIKEDLLKSANYCINL
ncbi:MAG: hypothetical protein GXO89_15670 [Chlorobi bacterium]|nr:hypothetical protein [Chlorobiota bacterium]